MDDRTLLELASRAAGYEVARWTDDGTALLLVGEQEPWNPRIDIGDATRLLLRMKLRVDYVGDQPCIHGVLQHGMTAEESFCRAIVRAAAMAQTTKEQP